MIRSRPSSASLETVDLPHRVYIASKDSLIDASDVHDSLLKDGMDSVLIDGLEHGEVLLWGKIEDEVIEGLNSIWKRGVDSAVEIQHCHATFKIQALEVVSADAIMSAKRRLNRHVVEQYINGESLIEMVARMC